MELNIIGLFQMLLAWLAQRSTQLLLGHHLGIHLLVIHLGNRVRLGFGLLDGDGGQLLQGSKLGQHDSWSLDVGKWLGQGALS